MPDGLRVASVDCARPMASGVPLFERRTRSLALTGQGEALYKFAVGVCLNASKVQVSRAVGQRQYGCGCRGGAEREIAEVR